jgi:hypothetical protein
VRKISPTPGFDPRSVQLVAIVAEFTINSIRDTIHATVVPKSEYEIILETFKNFLEIFVWMSGTHNRAFSDISFDPTSVHVGFVVDNVALGQVSLPVLPFSPVSIIPPMLHTHSPSTTDDTQVSVSDIRRKLPNTIAIHFIPFASFFDLFTHK